MFTVPAGGYAVVFCIASFTVAGAWDWHFEIPANGNYGTAGMTVTGQITATTTLTGGNLQLSGNTISSTNSNGNINIIPNGTGKYVYCKQVD